MFILRLLVARTRLLSVLVLLIVASLVTTPVQAGRNKTGSLPHRLLLPKPAGKSSAGGEGDVAPSPQLKKEMIVGRARTKKGKKSIGPSLQLNELKKIEVPQSARQALSNLSKTLQEGGIECKETFVSMVKNVVELDQPKTSPGSALNRPCRKKTGARKKAVSIRNQLTPRVFLEKANLFFTGMSGVGWDMSGGIRGINSGAMTADPAKTGKLSTTSLTAFIRNQETPITEFIQLPDEHIKQVGQLDSLKTLTSLCSHRGVPGELATFHAFNELFRRGIIPQKCQKHFSSMQHRRGIPDPRQVLNFWQWVINHDLEDILPSLSCVLNGRGIPDPGDKKPGSQMSDLEEFIGLFGTGNKPVPRRYLTCFTSMQNGRGVPAKERVVGFWDWVKANNLISVFPSLSSLLNGKGIPDLHDKSSNSPISALSEFAGLFGEGPDKIPSKYRTYFTSMHNGRGASGLVSKTAGFWAWINKKGWEDHISSISPLLNGRGIPEPDSKPLQEVEKFMTLFGEGANNIPLKYRSCFTSMQAHKGSDGLIDKTTTLWGWLDKDPGLLREVTRLNDGAGIPARQTLKNALDQIHRYGAWEEDDLPFLKMIALHVSAPPKKKLPLPLVQSFIDREKVAGRGAGVIHRLTRLLQRHGKDGVQAYQDIVTGSDFSMADKAFSLFERAKTVDLARMAVTRILPKEGFREVSRYLAVCRTLSSAPDPDEWQKIKVYTKVLWQAMDRDHKDRDDGKDISLVKNNWFIQGEYIASLWKLPEIFRAHFLHADAVRSLLGVVRSIAALKRLSRAGPGEGFREQCQACLNASTPLLAARDLNNLFQIHRTLRIPWYRQQCESEGDFSRVSTDSCGTGVVILPASGKSGKSLWQPFVAAVVNGLHEAGMSPAGQATITLPGELEEMEFPAPRLGFSEQGVSITNWTEEQYRLFADALELPGFESEDSAVPEPYVNSRHDQESGETTGKNGEAGHINGPGNLSFQLIERLLKSAVAIKTQTWKQLESQREHLPASILRLLGKKRHLRSMPETLRSYVQSVNSDRKHTDLPEPPDQDILTGFDITGNLLDDLLQQPILTTDTLKLLQPLADDLTAAQLTDIVARMDINLSWEERCPWMERSADNRLPVPDNWGIESWLEDDSTEDVPKPLTDEQDYRFLVPEWGGAEEIDELFQVSP